MATDAPVDQECVEGYLFVRSPLQILIFRRPPARGRIWVPISGKVTPSDPDFLHALRRELEEETGFVEGLSITSLDWSVPFTGPDGGRWRLHAYAVQLTEPRAPRLSDEHDAFEWVDPETAIARAHYEDNRGAVRRLRERFG